MENKQPRPQVSFRKMDSFFDDFKRAKTDSNRRKKEQSQLVTLNENKSLTQQSFETKAINHKIPQVGNGDTDMHLDTDSDLGSLERNFEDITRGIDDIQLAGSSVFFGNIHRNRDKFFEVGTDFSLLSITNESGHTIFHRVARDLNFELLQTIILKIKQYAIEKNSVDKTKEQLTKILSIRDKSGYSALAHACISSKKHKVEYRQNLGFHKKIPLLRAITNANQQDKIVTDLGNERLKVMEMIITNSKAIRLNRGKHDGWSLGHWLAFNEDIDALNLLKGFGFDQFFVPDREGNFPIDVAGKKRNEHLVWFFANSFLNQLDNELKPKAKLGYKCFAKVHPLSKRFHHSVLPYYHVIYWCTYFNSERLNKLARQILESDDPKIKPSPSLLPSYPIINCEGQTLFHSACYNDNIEMAEFFMQLEREAIDKTLSGNIYAYEGDLLYLKESSENAVNAEEEKIEKQLYKENEYSRMAFNQSWVSKISRYRKIIQKYARKVSRLGYLEINDSEIDMAAGHNSKDVSVNSRLKYLAFNTWEMEDYQGNTVLHISSIYGSIQCLAYFLKNYAELLKENKRFFSCPELIYHKRTRIFYKKYFEKLRQVSKKAASIDILSQDPNSTHNQRNGRKMSQLSKANKLKDSKLKKDPVIKKNDESLGDSEESMLLVDSRVQKPKRTLIPENFYYLCSNWFHKHKAFRANRKRNRKKSKNEKVSTPSTKSIRLVKSTYKKMLPTLKKVHYLITPNTFGSDPEFPIIAFKATMKGGTKHLRLTGLDNFISLIKNNGYSVWMFKGLYPGDYYVGLGASREKLDQICNTLNIKRKILGMEAEEGVKNVNFLNKHIHENDLPDPEIKFEPYTTREKRRIVYYDLHRLIDITALIKNSDIQEVRWMNNFSNLAKLRKALFRDKLLGMSWRDRSRVSYFGKKMNPENTETMAMAGYYGVFSAIMYRFFKYVFNYFFLFGFVGLLLQSYLSLFWFNNSGLTFIFYVLFALCLVIFLKLWSSRKAAIIKKLGVKKRLSKPISSFPENFNKGFYINEAISMKWMSKKLVIRTPNRFFLVKYVLLLLIFFGIYVTFLATLEYLFDMLQESVKEVRSVGNGLYFLAKGLMAGLMSWVFSGFANIVSANFISGLKIALRVHIEDYFVALNFMFNFLVLLGYPIYVFLIKAAIFKIGDTDFETKYFIVGYTLILYAFRTLVRWFASCDCRKSEKQFLFEMMIGTGFKQQKKLRLRKVTGTRRALITINTSCSTYLDHVELEFKKPLETAYLITESRDLTSPPSNVLVHYVETMLHLCIALTFFTILPGIMPACVVTMLVSNYVYYKNLINHSYSFMTFRTDVPLLKPIFAFIFLFSVVINFWHIYEFFPNFQARQTQNLGTVFGERVGTLLFKFSEFLEDHKFWIIFFGEHLILVVWGWVSLFGGRKRYRIKKTSSDDLGELTQKDGIDGYLTTLQKKKFDQERRNAQRRVEDARKEVRRISNYSKSKMSRMATNLARIQQEIEQENATKGEELRRVIQDLENERLKWKMDCQRVLSNIRYIAYLSVESIIVRRRLALYGNAGSMKKLVKASIKSFEKFGKTFGNGVIDCEETYGDSGKAQLYSFKNDQFFSPEAWDQFHKEMNLTTHEKIYLTPEKSQGTDKKELLTLADVLLMKQIWPSKFESYEKKDKLLILKEEFYRRVEASEIKAEESKLVFWSKVERCDFSKNKNTMKMIFDRFKRIYGKFGGMENKSQSLASTEKGNIKECVDLENFVDLDEIEDKLDQVLKFVNKEELLFINRIFYYCMRVSKDDFVFDDFMRHIKTMRPLPQNTMQQSEQVNYEGLKQKKLMLFLNFLDLGASLQISYTKIMESFRISKLNDLMNNKSVSKIVRGMMDSIGKGQNYILKADIFRWIFEENEDDDSELRDDFMELVLAYMA